MTLTVYGSGLSPYTRKVLACLLEKDTEHVNEPVNPFGAPDWFAKISPLGKIPVLRDTSVDADATLPDSSIISAYLESKYPEPQLYPSDPFDRARAQWYEEYSDTALSETIGLPFFYALVVRRLMGKEADRETAEDSLKNKMPPRFAYLDKELAGKDYLVGGAMSIADIAVASQLANFQLAGGSLDVERYPNLTSMVERVHGRPSFQQLITAGRVFLDGALGEATTS